MKDFGKKWLKVFIPAAIVLVTGISGLGTLTSGAMNIADGAPIKSVVKDMAIDSAKETAINTIYGGSEDGDRGSILDLFNKQKYKAVSDKKSGPWGYIAPGWYIECYRIDTNAYMGNRKYNKANGANLAWNMVNATDFEIGDFKNNNAYKNSYIAYDSNTFTLAIGELKKAKLNGYALLYDEYYNTIKFVNYKKGKETGNVITIDDNGINYINTEDGTIIATYNESSKSFEKTKDASLFGNNIPKDIDITIEGDTYTFDFGDRKYIVSANNDYVEYSSESCTFSGNAFQFHCRYNYNIKKEEWVSYDFTTMQNIKIQCSDGTVGEIKVVDDEDNSVEAVTAKSLSIALIKLGAHTTVDILVSESFGALDLAVEVATGESISDMINAQVDVIVDGVVNEIDDNTENSVDSKNAFEQVNDTVTNITDEITDTLGLPKSEDQKERERQEEQEKREEELKEAFENKDENGVITLPNGTRIIIKRE